MNVYDVTAVDFETEEAKNGTGMPPRPVGVAVYSFGSEPYYYAWGHPSDNNCTVATAASTLESIWRSDTVICHNAKFDLEVAHRWFGLPLPTPDRFGDTQFMAYLDDPRRKSLKLKDLASELLDLPPEEQDTLRDWLFANYPPAKRTKKNWAKYICKAPGGVVAPYAVGDVVRTLQLYKHFYEFIHNDKGLRRAYHRELILLPIILKMERKGVHVKQTVHEELDKREKELHRIETRLRRKIGDINFGHGPTLYKAMLARGMVDESKVQYTEKGNPRTSRDMLPLWCRDAGVVKALARRSRLVKIVGTYLRPWAEAAGGVFYPYFNQTRGDYEGGTRTGRLSSNFQQVPRDPDDPTLPFLRNFICAAPGKVLIMRDYSSQELRILAHYAESALLQAYIENPDLDVHDWVRQLIEDRTGLVLKRSPVKQANFLQIYGGGVPALSQKIGCPRREAEAILKAHRKALPEVRQLATAIEKQLRSGTLLRTWGGRLYDVETGFSKSGEWQKLYYKMINVLIQGSAADQTKELMIDADLASIDITLQVHDELLAESDPGYAARDMRILREIMNDSTDWDVPMRSDGKIGYDSWGQAIKWDDANDTPNRNDNNN